LLIGETPVKGHELEPVSVTPIISAYRQMVRELAFDVCELAPVTCLMALALGVPISPIPVFLDRRFHHGDLYCAPDSGVTTPRDLEGRRVGVRAYSVSTGVWGRGLLVEEHGVNLDSVTWVVDDEDHLPFPERGNIERVSGGVSLSELLRSSRIDAAFTGNAGTGRAGKPRAGWTTTDGGAGRAPLGAEPYPLFPQPRLEARRSFASTGIYPLHSVIVVRTELVVRDPRLATELYDAFVSSKRRHLATDPQWQSVPHLHQQIDVVGGDPLPYGVEPNHPSLDALSRLSYDQGLAADAQPFRFAPGDYAPG
jgi:4,5-dihydroxyphthalate decarboxylase